MGGARPWWRLGLAGSLSGRHPPVPPHAPSATLTCCPAAGSRQVRVQAVGERARGLVQAKPPPFRAAEAAWSLLVLSGGCRLARITCRAAACPQLGWQRGGGERVFVLRPFSAGSGVACTCGVIYGSGHAWLFRGTDYMCFFAVCDIFSILCMVSYEKDSKF